MSTSLHAGVVDYLRKFTLSEGFERPALPWDSVFKVESSMLFPKGTLLCTGEALIGGGSEIAHIDGAIGDIDGPVGEAYAGAIADQKDGLNNLLLVGTPNVRPAVSGVLITKVITDSLLRACQVFGPIQEGMAVAVQDCYEHGYFGNVDPDKIVIVASPFVLPGCGTKDGKPLEGDAAARSNYALWMYNYIGMVALIHDAVTGGLTQDERKEEFAAIRGPKGGHPYRGFKFSNEEQAAA